MRGGGQREPAPQIVRQHLQGLQQAARSLSAALTARSGRWVVASATRRLPAVSIMTGSGACGARGDVLGVADEGRRRRR